MLKGRICRRAINSSPHLCEVSYGELFFPLKINPLKLNRRAVAGLEFLCIIEIQVEKKSTDFDEWGEGTPSVVVDHPTVE